MTFLVFGRMDDSFLKEKNCLLVPVKTCWDSFPSEPAFSLFSARSSASCLRKLLISRGFRIAVSWLFPQLSLVQLSKCKGCPASWASASQSPSSSSLHSILLVHWSIQNCQDQGFLRAHFHQFSAQSWFMRALLSVLVQERHQYCRQMLTTSWEKWSRWKPAWLRCEKESALAWFPPATWLNSDVTT